MVATNGSHHQWPGSDTNTMGVYSPLDSGHYRPVACRGARGAGPPLPKSWPPCSGSVGGPQGVGPPCSGGHRGPDPPAKILAPPALVVSGGPQGVGPPCSGGHRGPDPPAKILVPLLCIAEINIKYYY